MKAVLIIFALSLSSSVFAELAVRVELGSDKIFRGIDQVVKSSLVPSVNLRYQSPDGWHTGIAASTIDLGAHPDRSTETLLFAGYGRPVSKRIHSELTLLNYRYQGGTTVRRFDWREAQVRFTLDGQFSLSFGAAKNWMGRDRESGHAELSYLLPLSYDLTLQSTAGVVFARQMLGENIIYGDLSLIYAVNGNSYVRLTAATSNSVVERRFGPARGGEHLTATLGMLF